MPGPRRVLCLAILGIAAMGLTGHLAAQDDGDPNGDVTATFANGKNAVIPCKIVLNSILIPIPTPDKKFAYLLFDTGANAPMLRAEFAQKIRVRSGSEITATGIGANTTVGGVSGGITFSLSGVTFHAAHWVILPSTGLDSTYGLPVEGVLGMDVLKNLVIRIDFAAQTIEFIKRESFRPPAGTVELPLTPNDAGCLVEATVKSDAAAATGLFLIDTGNNGTVELSRRFQDRQPGLSFRTLARNGQSGVGGTLLTAETICPALTLGGINVPGPLVDLDQQDQGVESEIDGTIGNEIWRRFDMTFDLPDNELYLQKNAHFSEPFSYVTAGMNVLASGDDYKTLTVHEVLPGSAGERAGFQAGDILAALDELGATPLKMASVYPLLHRVGAHHFVVLRGGKKIPLTLELLAPAPGIAPK